MAEHPISRGQRNAVKLESNFGCAGESTFRRVSGAGKSRRTADPLAGAKADKRSDARSGSPSSRKRCISKAREQATIARCRTRDAYHLPGHNSDAAQIDAECGE